MKRNGGSRVELLIGCGLILYSVVAAYQSGYFGIYLLWCVLLIIGIVVIRKYRKTKP